MRGTLHVDGVSCHESSKNGAKSVKVISYSIHNVNAGCQSSRAFTIYLGIIGSSSAEMDRIIVDEIQRATTVTGKYGCYFKKDNQWYHLRWYVEGYLCDYAEHVNIAGCGSPSSNRFCLLCPIAVSYYNPCFNELLGLSWKQVFKANMKFCGSSLHFLSPQSLFRLSSYICHGFLSGKKRLLEALKLCGVNDALWESELKQMTCHFQKVDKEFLTSWVPIVQTETAAANRCRDLAKEVLNGSKRESAINTMLGSDSITLPDNDRRSVQERNTLLPRVGWFILDSMHLFSNWVIRCAECLENCIAPKKNKDIVRILWKWLSAVIFCKPMKRQPGFIPLFVNAYAYKNLKSLVTSESWINESVIFPSVLKGLTCEQRIVLYMNLFSFMYKESLSHPVVHAMNRLMHLIAFMFFMRHDRKKASEIQAKISYYLSQLESNCIPGFSTTTTHLLNHLYQVLFCVGTLSGYNNFITERCYKKTKNTKVATRYSVDILARREHVFTLCSIFSFGKRLKLNLCQGKGILHGRCFDGITLELIKKNFVDDYVFSRNTYFSHRPYFACIKESEKVIRLSEWGRFLHKADVLTWDKKVYRKLTWNGHQYISVGFSDGYSLDWLDKNRACICCCRVEDDLKYFLLRGYVVASTGENKYPLALCSPIGVEDIDPECPTPLEKLVKENWMEELEEVILISMYQLSIGNILPHWFADNLLGLSPMCLNVYPFKDLADCSLFKVGYNSGIQ